MVWVNLLPWRAARLSAQWHRWILVMTVMMLLPLAASGPGWGLRALNQQRSNVVSQLKQANHLAGERLRQLTLLQQERDAQRKKVERQLRRREQLEQWTFFIRDLASTMPESLWLTGITKGPNSLTMTGISQGTGDLDRFRQQLQLMPLMRQVTTGPLTRSENGNLSFRLLATFSVGSEPHE